MASNKPATQKKTPAEAVNNSTELILAEKFTELFEADKKRLYSFIHSYIFSSSAADDVFQETCLTLWKEFENFELGTNFSLWANAIAYRRAKNYQRSQKKYSLGFSDSFFEEFQEFQDSQIELEAESRYQDQKLVFLEQCRSLLSTPLQQVYQNFYIQNKTANEIATDSGRSVYAIRKVVHKIRKKLFDCIDGKISRGSL